jgi:hypothetical protein
MELGPGASSEHSNFGEFAWRTVLRHSADRSTGRFGVEVLSTPGPWAGALDFCRRIPSPSPSARPFCVCMCARASKCSQVDVRARTMRKVCGRLMTTSGCMGGWHDGWRFAWMLSITIRPVGTHSVDPALSLCQGVTLSLGLSLALRSPLNIRIIL